MDKYDYITATIEEEKDRLEKLIAYQEGVNDTDGIVENKERYNNILLYLSIKNKYQKIEDSIEEDREKLERLLIAKEEYSVDNILLEDTLLSMFNEDTRGIYRNLLYENIQNEDFAVRDILYLLFDKQSDYQDLVTKRSRLKQKLDSIRYPKTYQTILNQEVLIDKQRSILDEIFIVQNNIKIKEARLRTLTNQVMTEPILKLLYEFWIVDSYDPMKVDRTRIFLDNKALSNLNISNLDIKNDKKEFLEENERINEDSIFDSFPDLNLPGISSDMTVKIDGKNYVGED